MDARVELYRSTCVRRLPRCHLLLWMVQKVPDLWSLPKLATHDELDGYVRLSAPLLEVLLPRVG